MSNGVTVKVIRHLLMLLTLSAIASGQAIPTPAIGIYNRTTKDCRDFVGGDYASIVNRCMKSLIYGGTADAKGLIGSFNVTSDMFTGIAAMNKDITLVTGWADLTVSAKQTIDHEKISLIGVGTRWNCTLNDDCIRVKLASFNSNNAGEIRGFKITGSSSANAVGIHIGDITGIRLVDMWITDFTGANSAGIWFDNTTNWTEQTKMDNVRINNSTKLLKLSVNGGTGSFGYTIVDKMNLEIQNGQTAVSSENNATLYNSDLKIGINKSGNASGTIISLTNTSQWINNHYQITAENNGGGGGTGISTVAGTLISGTGTIIAAGLTNSIAADTVSTLLPYFSTTASTTIIESPLIISSRNTSPQLGTYFLPMFSSAGFRMGVGMNLWFDGTNWVGRNDGGSNGGGAILLPYGSSALQFFVLPNTGGSNKSVSNATLDSTHLRASLSDTIFTSNVPFSATTYSTATNCLDSAGAAACGSAAAGSIVIDAGATTVVVSTTAVTANSQIFIQEDSSLNTRLGITCNTGVTRIYQVTARTAATSFTITSSAAPVTNPACLSYSIVN